jgi:CRP/FNR family cyclic AMP-dependent transcriptional regulator
MVFGRPIISLPGDATAMETTIGPCCFDPAELIGKETRMGLNDTAFEKTLSALPLTTYRAGETVLSDGLKTGRLLILKSGEVAVLKNSAVLATVDQPGAVFGELSALLDQAHAADVQALQDSQFYVADAGFLERDLVALLHVARILARRLVAANDGLVELKNEIQTGPPRDTLRKVLANMEEILMAGGASREI